MFARSRRESAESSLFFEWKRHPGSTTVGRKNDGGPWTEKKLVSIHYVRCREIMPMVRALEVLKAARGPDLAIHRQRNRFGAMMEAPN